MTREQDALFAEKVAGWTDVQLEETGQNDKDDLYVGRPPWISPEYVYPVFVLYYSSGPQLVVEMMAAIEKLCGTHSSVVLHRENGTYTATARWFDNKWHESYRDGDGTANGALLALGLAVADEVQNMHEGDSE